MFGCVVAGRPLLTDLTQIDETHAYFSLQNASTINHITIFLTGAVPFPPGYGATVHFFWPGKGFQLLGMLSNEKPSAIFRLRGTFTPGAAGGGAGRAQGLFGGVGGEGGMNQDVTAVLGLAIEPLEVIASQVPTTSSAPGAGALVKSPTIADTVTLAEKIVKHLFNYVSGFSGGGGEVLVPMSVVMKWYDNFINKIKTSGGIGFLDNIE